MKKRTLFLIGIACIILVLVYKIFGIAVLPVKSSNLKLTIIHYGGPNLESITLRQYIDDRYVRSYFLDLIIDPRYQIPQKYELPQLVDGSVKLIVKCSQDDPFEIDYENAFDLYQNGLLIYTTSDFNTTIEVDGVVDYDRYIYFKSGDDQIVYVQKVGTIEWTRADNPPPLKRFTRKWWGYSPIDYEENKWTEMVEE